MKHLPKPEIEWRDLLTLSRGQVALNLGLSWPWLAGSWWLAAQGH